MTRIRAANAAALPSDRRAFLGSSLALASVVAASAVPAVAAVEHPDAELLDLGVRWVAVELDLNRSTGGDLEEEDERWDRSAWLHDAIMALPAHTGAGLAVKMRIIASGAQGVLPDDDSLTAWTEKVCVHGDYREAVALASLTADILRLAAGDAR